MKKLLVVIDMQNDFIDGALGTKEAEAIVDNVVAKIKEYPKDWKIGEEAYYPVNDVKNLDLYAKYVKKAETISNVIFGGRLGEYKYYDMDAVIASVLNMCDVELA